MANDCIPYFENSERVTCVATATVVGKRFVLPSASLLSGPGIPTGAQIGASDPTDGGRIQAAHATAAGPALGVSTWDAAVGEEFGAISAGTVPVTAEANIAVGVQVQVGAAGKAITLASGVAVGVCCSAATAGNDAMIKLNVG